MDLKERRGADQGMIVSGTKEGNMTMGLVGNSITQTLNINLKEKKEGEHIKRIHGLEREKR